MIDVSSFIKAELILNLLKQFRVLYAVLAKNRHGGVTRKEHHHEKGNMVPCNQYDDLVNQITDLKSKHKKEIEENSSSTKKKVIISKVGSS